MTPVFKVPREINNKAYKIIDDTDVSLTIVYKINYVVNIDAQYYSTSGKVNITVLGNPALELKRIGYGE
jgi:predicted methyltransferase